LLTRKNHHYKALVISEQRISKLGSSLREIKQSIAYIDFPPDSFILDANSFYIGVVGPYLEEVKGKEHKIFYPDLVSQTSGFNDFWKSLAGTKALLVASERVNSKSETIWLETVYLLLRYLVLAKKQVSSAIKTAIDVTEKSILLALLHWNGPCLLSRLILTRRLALPTTIIFRQGATVSKILLDNTTKCSVINVSNKNTLDFGISFL